VVEKKGDLSISIGWLLTGFEELINSGLIGEVVKVS
jgi:hypothetical protein